MSPRLLLIAVLMLPPVWAGDWRTGQAPRAVLGQISFSAHENGLNPTVLSVANGKLFVADASQHVLAYDLSAAPIGHTSDAGACAVCGGVPSTVANQTVPTSSARFATSVGGAVAIADPANHRILYWRNAAAPNSRSTADVVLSGGDAMSPAEPASVAMDARHLYVGDAGMHRVLIWERAGLTTGQPAEAALTRIVDPVALAADGTNLYVAESGNHRVLVFAPGAVALAADAVVNSASLAGGTFAPGTLITIRGSQLAANSETAANDGSEKLPTSLAGEEVMVDGRPIPLLSVSPGEIQAQLPYTLTYAGEASVWLRGSLESNAITIRLGAVSPGIFAFPGSTEPRMGLLLHGGSEGAGTPVTKDDPAAGGEVIVVWASGLGLTDAPEGEQPEAGRAFAGPAAEVRSAVSARLNGEPADVISAKLPESAVGVYEVRVALPATLPAGSAVQLTLQQGSASSNTVTFAASSTIHN